MRDSCWFTSFVGYPNFFKKEGRGRKLAESFCVFAQACLDGISYQDAKKAFRQSGHQVETKKSAFQEAGLLYVVPRSDTITLTPVGKQIYEMVVSGQVIPRRREVLLTLCRALGRYQFSSPLPIGGSRYRDLALSTDVLPYLAVYYLLLSLDGHITEHELTGLVFGLWKMQELPSVRERIRMQRRKGKPFVPLGSLPRDPRTAANLRIYFIARLGLDSEILTKVDECPAYGRDDRCFELTQLGVDVVGTVLDVEWPGWNRGTPPPVAKAYPSVEQYFSQGIGHVCGDHILIKARAREHRELRSAGVALLNPLDLESLKELPKRQFEEGRRKLISHTRLEQARNTALVRAAKALFKAEHGRLYCEVCGFDFDKAYGRRGRNFIEAHHNVPISEIAESATLTVADLSMVCSNCHRMIHRKPWLTVEGLKEEMGGN